MFDLSSVLRMLPAVGPVVAAVPAFREIYDRIVGTFGENDQQILRDAYPDLIADNDEGHARLQAKLASAAGR